MLFSGHSNVFPFFSIIHTLKKAVSWEEGRRFRFNSYTFSETMLTGKAMANNSLLQMMYQGYFILTFELEVVAPFRHEDTSSPLRIS